MCDVGVLAQHLLLINKFALKAVTDIFFVHFQKLPLGSEEHFVCSAFKAIPLDLNMVKSTHFLLIQLFLALVFVLGIHFSYT